jgi:DNA ligase-associated metallophosphoesterase
VRALGSDAEIVLDGERLLLLGERAVFWGKCKALIIADPHWGKAAAFRAAAVAVPEAVTQDDLLRLDGALDRTGAKRLIILGDLIHAEKGRSQSTFDAISDWRKRRSRLKVVLVRGNHDRRAGDPPEEWRFEVVDEPLAESPFCYRHYPEECEEGYTLAGHLHPAVKLIDEMGASHRFACFHFGKRIGVLPAFGSFTGTATVRPKVGDRVFVVSEGEVVSV